MLQFPPPVGKIHVRSSLMLKHSPDVVVAAAEIVGVVVAAAGVVGGGFVAVGAAEIVDGVETAVVTVVVEGSVVVGESNDDAAAGVSGSDGYVGLKGVVAASIGLGGEVIQSHVEFVDLFDPVTGQPQENVK